MTANRRKGHPSNSKRFRIFQFDNFTCQYCGVSASEVKLEIDHIIPFSNGGGNEIENLITSCHSCNIGKGNRKIKINRDLLSRSEKIQQLKSLKRLRELRKEDIMQESSECLLDGEFSRKLRVFLAENNIRKKDFAVELEVTAETISNWINKNTRPNRLHAIMIDNYTRGLISMEDMGY